MSGPCTDCGGPDYHTLEARIEKLARQLLTATAKHVFLAASLSAIQEEDGPHNHYLDKFITGELARYNDPTRWQPREGDE